MRQDIPIKQLLCHKAAARKLPVSGGFELTPRCSLNCKMCYIRMTPEEMKALGRERTAAEWIELGQQAKAAGTVFLLLTGGEPFLREDFREIYSRLSAMGFSIDINSNGTLIDDNVLSWLTQTPPGKVNITLYGASRESYGALCGVPEAFDRVCFAIDALRKAGILVSLNATMTPQNAQDAAQIVDFAKARDLQLKMTAYVYPGCRRSTDGFPERLPAEKAGALTAESQWRYWGREVMERRLNAIRPGEENFFALDDCVYSAETGLRCMAGSSQFWVTWNGELLPCCMLPWIKADPFALGFREAWRRVSSAVQEVPVAPQCTSCSLKPFCPSCAAINRCETGSTSNRPEYLCELTAAYCKNLDALLQGQKEISPSGTSE